ncbi:hypothetical protein Vafri_16212 [Volvox africanus]|uniref:3-ketoacyl-CoA synthase n=1 Tax=Volvox africanus TaxID=51714 RepID=A0A8J4BH10_9CHLO|nr:hypothetical protein Vafri_16212 [Volvox africanus]
MLSLFPPRVYLYDLNIYKPPISFKLDQRAVIRTWQDSQFYTSELLEFQTRVFARSGLSPTETHLPPTLNPAYVGSDVRTDLEAADKECRMAVCGAVEGLFNKTGLNPADIDIVVTTCSIFCPTPSMASMVVNAFGLRRDIQSYHLGGMGCANGVVAVNVVADLLAAHPNSNALFVTTETLAPAFYFGTERHRLVTNLLFRMGAAAMLITNKPSLVQPAGPGRRGAKYQLLRRVRVHTGQSDDAYTAIHFSPDEEGKNGIYLGKNIVKEASRALSMAMTQIAPYVLTWQQLAEAGIDALRRRRTAAADRRRNRRRDDANIVNNSDGSNGDVSRSSGSGTSGVSGTSGKACVTAAAAAHDDTAAGFHTATASTNTGDASAPADKEPAAAASRSSSTAPPYKPNFQKSTVSHFLLHAGGAKVLDGLGEALQLDDTKLAPSRNVLHDYGNISSSTTWYTLACIETTQGVRRGERILQVGVGSGIKCGVNVWKALRNVHELHEGWSHRLTPEQRTALALRNQVDVAHGWYHVSLRAVFALLMVLLAASMHFLMLHRTATFTLVPWGRDSA